jgi:hypothetical protein
MSTIELEAQKASLAREILGIDNEKAVHDIWLLLKSYKPIAMRKVKPQRREIGFLEGKAKVTFHDDWSMTPEELGMA